MASSSVIQSSLPKTPDRGSQKARGWRVTLSTSVSCERKVRGWIVEVAVGGRSGIPKFPRGRGRAPPTWFFHLVPQRIPSHHLPRTHRSVRSSSLSIPLPCLTVVTADGNTIIIFGGILPTFIFCDAIHGGQRYVPALVGNMDAAVLLSHVDAD